MIRHFRQRFTGSVLLLALLTVLVPAVGIAATDTKKTEQKAESQNISQSVTQSFNADPTVQLGMIVASKEKDGGTVEPLVSSRIAAMLGVVIRPNDTTFTLTPQNSTVQQVFIAKAGRYSTLVSNQNGPIKAGDYITISAVSGIGMKADNEQAIILGKAITAFEGNKDVVGKVSIKDDSGLKRDVSISRITVEISIAGNPLASEISDKVPGALNRVAVAVSGKPISAGKIYLGLATLLVASFIAGNVVYSGIKNGMAAIGRNPLSKKTIFRSLIQTVIAGLIIFIVGIFAVYLLLKL